MPRQRNNASHLRFFLENLSNYFSDYYYKQISLDGSFISRYFKQIIWFTDPQNIMEVLNTSV